MIIILSPAKTLDYDSPVIFEETSSPRFPSETETLVKKMQTLDPSQLEELMGISQELADLNAQRFLNFDLAPMRQAIMTFNGHVYRDIRWQHYTPRDYEFAQQHVRILSGLYGLLRPLDLIKPYRLEMGTKLTVGSSHTLYDYWGDKLSNLLLQDLSTQGDATLINLASNEYSKAVLHKDLDADIITPIFKDWNEKSSSYRIVSVYAKLARGTMTNWVIENKINDLEDLERYAEDHYTLLEKKEKVLKHNGRKRIDLIFTRQSS